MTLASNCVLYYVLRQSAVRGSLTEGKVELHEHEGLMVYDTFERLNEYISGDQLRSWALVCDGILVSGWSHIMPEDAKGLIDQ